jgi:hypothetical protein
VQRRLPLAVAAGAHRAAGASPIEGLPVGEAARKTERLLRMLAAVADVDVHALVDQPGHHRQVSGLGGHVEARLAVQAIVEIQAPCGITWSSSRSGSFARRRAASGASPARTALWKSAVLKLERTMKKTIVKRASTPVQATTRHKLFMGWG